MTILTINPIAFKLFGIPVHWYGIIIAIGMLIGIELASREFQKKKFDDDFVMSLMMWAIPIGFIGARLYYVVFEWSYYKEHIGEIIAIWNGGIAIYGGVIAAAIAIICYCRYHFQQTWLVTDIAAPYLLLVQAIGRWGNFVNQEAHGGATTRQFLSQTLHLPQFIVEQMNINGIYYQPTFLYESVWNVIGVLFLLWTRKQPKRFLLGETTLSYFIWYAFGRFWIEGLRTDSLWWGSVRVSQGLAFLLFIGSLFLLLWRRTHKEKLSIPYYSDCSSGVSKG